MGQIFIWSSYLSKHFYFQFLNFFIFWTYSLLSVFTRHTYILFIPVGMLSAFSRADINKSLWELGSSAGNRDEIGKFFRVLLSWSHWTSCWPWRVRATMIWGWRPNKGVRVQFHLFKVWETQKPLKPDLLCKKSSERAPSWSLSQFIEFTGFTSFELAPYSAGFLHLAGSSHY